MRKKLGILLKSVFRVDICLLVFNDINDKTHLFFFFNFQVCEWTIQPPSDATTITVSFLHRFHVEMNVGDGWTNDSCYDYLEIINGSGKGRNYISGRFLRFPFLWGSVQERSL